MSNEEAPFIPDVDFEKRLITTFIMQKPSPKAQWLTLTTLALMALITQMHWVNFLDLSKYLAASQRTVFLENEYWRLLTAIFVHSDIAHLISNMYMVAIFSFFVSAYFGPYIYPLITIIAAVLTNGLVIATYPLDIQLVGASGLVYVLGGFWLTMYMLIQRQYNIPSRLLRVSGVGLMVFFPTSFEPTTSYRAHVIGFVLGFLIATIYFLKRKNKYRPMRFTN